MTLKRNEILILSLGAVVVLAMVYYLFVISPAISKEKSLKRSIQRTEKDLAEMTALKKKWDRLKRSQLEAEKTLVQRGRRFTLLSFLEGISREVGIDDNIQYMKPLSFPEETGELKETGMEIKLEDVDLAQLVEYLHKIEYSGKLLNIRRIKVQRMSSDAGPSLLRAILQVNTYVKES
jgi:type II secretory pathway component PulM